MNDCYFEKKDWRACRKEVRPLDPSSIDLMPEISIQLCISKLNEVGSKN